VDPRPKRDIHARVIDDKSITREQKPGILSRNRIPVQNGRFRSYRWRFTAALWIPPCPARRSLTRVALATLGHAITSGRVNKIAAVGVPPPLWENVLTLGVTRELCRTVAHLKLQTERMSASRTCVRVHAFFLPLLPSLFLSLSLSLSLSLGWSADN